jgi:RsiW-degrading membrane proteinase PrsW (M82 family)
MPLRLRKLIGMIALIVFLALYVLAVLSVASARFADAPWWSHLIFFALGGLLWVPPAMLIIRWMERPVGDDGR